MENIPKTPEDDSDDSEDSSSGKKKKTAAGLGAFIVEPKAAEPEKRESFWQKLTGSEEKPKTEKSAETAEAQGETPIDKLNPEEELFVEQALVRAGQEDGEAEDMPLDDETVAAKQAVEQFHDKIISENKPSAEAFAETMQELGVETSAEAISDAPDAVSDAPQPMPLETINLHHKPEAPVAVETAIPSPVVPATNLFRPLTGAGKAPNVAAAPANEYIPDYNENNTAGAALLGGITGYLIGRRRSRIKTEKRLLPVQKKLEKEVTSLQLQLTEKETLIRKTAVERLRAQRQVRVEKQPGQRHFAEKATLGTSVPPERIGKVLIQAEAAPVARRPETAKPVATELIKNREVETMSRTELLALSEKIVVEGSTLRQIYETKLVGERGLRRLIIEHLRGGDIKRTLRRELVEREIDFERDPVMRDQAAPAAQVVTTATLNTLLEQAGAMSAQDSQEAAVLKARAAHEAVVKQRQQHRRRIVDTALAGTITILIALVLVLLFTR